MKNFTSTHSQTAKHIVRYLIDTFELKKQYESIESIEKKFHDYIDAAYDNNIETKRFYSKYLFKL